MNINQLLGQKQQIVDHMRSYMKYGAADNETDEDYDPEFDAGYTQQDIDECDLLLTTFLNGVNNHSSGDTSVLMNDVKTVILLLNQLNKKCDHTLIETSEREDICVLINDALRQLGLTFDSDITEQWREF